MGNTEPQNKVGCYLKIYTLKYISQIVCLRFDVFLTD